MSSAIGGSNHIAMSSDHGDLVDVVCGSPTGEMKTRSSDQAGAQPARRTKGRLNATRDSRSAKLDTTETTKCRSISDANPTYDKASCPGRHVSVGPASAPHRSYYYAMGMTDREIANPFVGVATCWNEAAPCNISLARQAHRLVRVESIEGCASDACRRVVRGGVGDAQGVACGRGRTAQAEGARIGDREGPRPREQERSLGRERDRTERARAVVSAERARQPPLRRPLFACRSPVHEILSFEVGPRRVGRAGTVDERHLAALEQRRELREGGMERKAGHRRAPPAVPSRQGQRSAERQLSPRPRVRGVADRRNEVQAVRRSAQADDDEESRNIARAHRPRRGGGRDAARAGEPDRGQRAGCCCASQRTESERE